MLATARRLAFELPPPETGTLRDDLVVHLTHLADKMANTPSGRLLVAIIGEAAVNEEMRSRMRDFIRQGRALALGLLRAAQARGELPPDVDIDQMLDLLGAPIFLRLLTGGGRSPTRRSSPGRSRRC